MSSKSPQIPPMDEGGSSSSTSSSASIAGVDVRALLDATLPVVKCVLLRSDGTMEEKEVDMTPKKQEVAGLLGRPVAFLGQWENLEIIIVTVRDDTGCPVNKHKLPAPFDDATVKGDILLIRTDSEAVPQDVTMSEYVEFTKKDPEPWQLKKPEDEPNEEDGDDDEDEEEEDEEDYEEGEEGEDDEDDEAAAAEFKAFLLAKVSQKFEETNGRAPTEEELTAMKASLDQKFGGGEEEDDDEDDEEEEDGSAIVLNKIVTAFNEAHGRDPTEDEIKDILRKMQGQVVSDDAEVEAEDAAGSEPASKKQKK